MDDFPIAEGLSRIRRLWMTSALIYRDHTLQPTEQGHIVLSIILLLINLLFNEFILDLLIYFYNIFFHKFRAWIWQLFDFKLPPDWENHREFSAIPPKTPSFTRLKPFDVSNRSTHRSGGPLF